MWVFSEPHEYEDFNVFGMPSLVPVNRTEKEFFAKKDVRNSIYTFFILICFTFYAVE